jgi:hypothetical protein
MHPAGIALSCASAQGSAALGIGCDFNSTDVQPCASGVNAAKQLVSGTASTEGDK